MEVKVTRAGLYGVAGMVPVGTVATVKGDSLHSHLEEIQHSPEAAAALAKVAELEIAATAPAEKPKTENVNVTNPAQGAVKTPAPDPAAAAKA